MNKKETIDLLLYNVALEHSAIVQYLYHIFLITDGNITSEIESIARQEMRHLKWFAQKVVQLGGRVVLNRLEDMIVVGGPDWADMISKDVDAERMAIEIYSRQLELVKDDSVKRLLERVIKDEEDHQVEFSQLLEQIKKNSPEEERPTTQQDPEVVQLLNRFLKEEYGTILKYLHEFFHAKDCQYKDMMLDLAVESMVHMGKLGEKIGKMGGIPHIEVDVPLYSGGALQEKVMGELSYEQKTGEDYSQEIKTVKDPDLLRLLRFIEHQEEYHKHMLKEFLDRMRKLTVGDLRKKDAGSGEKGL
ncbi:hypothetical protein Thal_1231 [Thermocrinis albus DSM 14484]|uniref:Ferritin/DPS domain-containing protein n=1 Tax=Thermocrinis albus (strain DSM 14484 / JCM 11386 / HI 11/12) TaxID=638303 RepID=D3SM83_THEAH|nr:ferritin-like domain-containing protein [Thermocrinis albus]ADC89863.1 hypothetical protein Thal_1231 [Thermocrinis albus DSM 14484]